MGWGVSLLGFGAVMEALDDLLEQVDTDVVYLVGTNVHYAVFQEKGTRNQEPQPFLGPAAREAERSIQRIAAPAQSTDEAIKRVALFIERRSKENAPVDTGNLRASLRAVRIQ